MYGALLQGVLNPLNPPALSSHVAHLIRDENYARPGAALSTLA
jgi:hypothetical protein